MRLGSILFDLDGTLVDSAQGIAVALDEIRSARGGGPVDLQSVRAWVSLGAKTLVANALGDLAGDSDQDLAAFRAILGAQTPDPGHVYPGVGACLERLAKIAPLAIVTNKPEALSRQLLEQLGLAPLFQVIVGGDTAEQPKPHPAPMLRALEAVGGQGATSWMIGDSIVDARAAQAVGAAFMLFEGGYGARECPPELVNGRFICYSALADDLTEVFQRS
jgi:phosphoglycolate phosphatase